MRALFLCLIFVIGAPGLTLSQTGLPPALPPDASLADWLAFLEHTNPELAAARAESAAAAARVPQARALPNPVLEGGYYLRQDKTMMDPARYRVGLMQDLPWFGKRDSRGAIAAAEAESARHRTETLRLSLRRRFRDAYYEYAYLGRAIVITREMLDLLQQLERSAAARYRAGEPLTDTLRLQLEIGRLANDLRSLEAMLTPQRALLNSLLGRPADAALTPPSQLPPEAVVAPDETRFAALAAASHPMIAERQALVTAEGAALRLARLDRFPDLTVGLETERHDLWSTQAEETDMVMATVRLDLPVWLGRNRAAIREAEQRTAGAQRQVEAVRHTLDAERQMAVFRLRDAQRRVRLYQEELVPRAHQTLEIARAAYETGKASFTELLDAERLLLEFSLAAARAQTDQAQGLAAAQESYASDLLPHLSPAPGSGTVPPLSPPQRQGDPP